MNICTGTTRWSLLLTICIGLLLANTAQAQKGKGGGGGNTPSVLYRVIPIESIVPGPRNAIGGINSSGQVCGWMTGSGERFPYVWTVGSGMIPLQTLISSEDRQTWHLETAGAINELEQIVGFMSRQDNPDSWAAYRLDLADGAKLNILETGLISAYAAKPGGFHTEIQINDCGDAVLGANGTIYVYPAGFPEADKIDLQYRGYTYGINCSGEIIVSAYDDETATYYGHARLTPQSDGSYAETMLPPDYVLTAINDFGVMAGRYRDPKSGNIYSFRYADPGLDYDASKEMILKDGRKTVSGSPAGISNNGINNHGDIGLIQVAIHTAENVYINIKNLIYPGDTLPNGTLCGIAERNDTELPPAIMRAQETDASGQTIWVGYYLLPVPAGN